MITATECLRSTGQPFRVGRTFDRSRQNQALKGSMSFVGDFPVRTFQKDEIGTAPQVWMENDQDCGQNLPEFFAHYDPDTQSLKTLQKLLFEDSTECCVILPRAGSMLNGNVCRQPDLVPRSDATGYSWLPAPTATEYKGCSRARYLDSPALRKSRTAEVLRTCESDPIYPNPCFIEMAMGFPVGHTDLEDLETLSSPKLQNGLEND